MCIIIDANRLSLVISQAPEAIPVLSWLKRPSGQVVVGGTKLRNEYKRVVQFISLLATLDSAGKVKRYDDSIVDLEQAALESGGALRSDDPHIIALALISGCRLLFSDDGDLHTDFTNPSILAPRGKVYQRASHSHLLQNASTCV